MNRDLEAYSDDRKYRWHHLSLHNVIIMSLSLIHFRGNPILPWTYTVLLYESVDECTPQMPVIKYKRRMESCVRDRPTIFPVNTIHQPNVGSMLGQRRRRWPNIEPTLDQCIVLIGLVLLYFYFIIITQFIVEHNMFSCGLLWPVTFHCRLVQYCQDSSICLFCCRV